MSEMVDFQISQDGEVRDYVRLEKHTALRKALEIAKGALGDVIKQIPLYKAKNEWPDTNESRMYRAAHEALAKIAELEKSG